MAGRAVWFYAGKLAWPVNLLSVYPRWQVSTSAWWQYLYPVGAAALLGVLWHWRGRLGRGPLAAVLCFGVLVSPLVGIFNVAYHLYSFVADHFQYHAAPALFALFASGVARLRSWNGRALGRAVDVGSGGPRPGARDPHQPARPDVPRREDPLPDDHRGQPHGVVGDVQPGPAAEGRGRSARGASLVRGGAEADAPATRRCSTTSAWR